MFGMFLQRSGHFTLGEVISDHNDTNNLVKFITKDVLMYDTLPPFFVILGYIDNMITYVFPGGTNIRGEHRTLWNRNNYSFCVFVGQGIQFSHPPMLSVAPLLEMF